MDIPEELEKIQKELADGGYNLEWLDKIIDKYKDKHFLILEPGEIDGVIENCKGCSKDGPWDCREIFCFVNDQLKQQLEGENG